MSTISLIAQYNEANLKHMLERFQFVARNIAPCDRVNWAQEECKNIYRDGWFINTPVGKNGDADTVYEHKNKLRAQIIEYFPLKSQEEASLLAEYHDAHESLANSLIGGTLRDLNPRFNKSSYRISEDDKCMIESLARDVIFEGKRPLKSLLDSYPTSTQMASQLFKGLDRICVMDDCVAYIESSKYSYADFDAYWKYWTPENALEKLPRLIAEHYIEETWERAEQLRKASLDQS